MSVRHRDKTLLLPLSWLSLLPFSHLNCQPSPRQVPVGKSAAGPVGFFIVVGGFVRMLSCCWKPQKKNSEVCPLSPSTDGVVAIERRQHFGHYESLVHFHHIVHSVSHNASLKAVQLTQQYIHLFLHWFPANDLHFDGQNYCCVTFVFPDLLLI